MVIGPIETVRLYTKNLDASRRFYTEVLGLKELVASDRWAIFDTGQAKLLVERLDDEEPDENGEQERFAHFSFTVADMEKAVQGLQGAPIEWLGPPERQEWGGILAYLKDPDGTILTLAQYPAPKVA
jgi:catechol 2,3-dioxygenase-like lactoylglutathione lyase family enzyme